MDKYTENIIKEIKNAKTDEELAKIINRVYDDGIDFGYDLVSEYYFRGYLY